MAASAQSTLESIERRRAQLQDSVDKLSAALHHWTTWEAEYTLFKDEIESAPTPSPANLRQIARDLDATLLNEKEVADLLGAGRDADQVVDRVQRRIDYVQQNSAAVERQLDAAEKQLAGVDVLLDPGVDNEEGLPMMDIEEELDDEGNAVSSSVNQTGKGAAEVIEVLRKAGVRKAELEKMQGAAGEETPSVLTKAPPATKSKPEVESTRKSAELSPTTQSKPEVESKKKSVSFASEVDVEPPRGRAALEKDGYNDDLDALNFTRGTKVIELDQDDNLVASYPIIPQGESPEDAELRRRMLQYGLSEVGQVVAELDLDHPTAEYSDFDDDYDEDEGEDEDEDEDEDEYGRSTATGVTDDYRQQMLALERKLNVRMLENIGPQAADDQTVEQAESVRLLKIQKDEKFDSTIDAAKPSTSSSKKGVRFADDIDISTPSTSTPTISPTIIERPAQTTPQAPTAPSQPTKVSRFKSTRTTPLPTPPIPPSTPQPSGPAGRTLAPTIIERAPSTTSPSAPDEFDPVVMDQEIRREYHKARNRFIQQKGGFKPSDEDEDERKRGEGEGRRVSRFLAGKLKAEEGRE